MKYFVLCYILLLTPVSTTTNNPNEDLFEYLTSYRNVYSDYYNIILCSKSDRINLVKMISSNFGKYVNVLTAEDGLMKNPITENPQTFIVDLYCSDSKMILQQAERLILFRKPYQWLLMAVGDDTVIESQSDYDLPVGRTRSYWNFIETLTPLVDADVKVIEEGSPKNISITGIYKLTKNGTMIKEALATFTHREGLAILNNKSIPIRRWNLQGTLIPASLVATEEGTLKHLEDMVDKHIDTTSKGGYNAIILIEAMLNAKIKFIIRDSWGIFKNGSWTGMVGDLETGEAEIGASPIFVQQQRMDVVEYYATVTPARSRFIYMSPPLSHSNNIFVMPFDKVVWYSCIAMVAISCLLLYTALKVEKKVRSGEVEIDIKKYKKFNFTEILIMNIGAICLQGTVIPTEKPSGRIITLFLYLWYMFLYISYSASIVAILQSSDTSIRTLADLLRSPLQAGAHDIVYSQHYFRTAEEPIRKAIYEKKIAPKGQTPHFLSVDEGIKKVRQGLYAYHVETNSGYLVVQKTFTEEEKCGLQEIKNSFIAQMDPWLVFKKRSPYAELLKIGVKRVIEQGFKTRTVRRFFTFKPTCGSKSSRFVSVGITDCYYAFMLLICGFLLSFSIMVLEIIKNRSEERHKKLKNRRLEYDNSLTN